MPPLILTRLSRPAIIFSSNRSFPFSLTELLNTYFLHWSPEKALWIGAHTLSWDARCAGIHIGFGIGVLCHLLLDRRASRLPRLSILALAGLLFIPLFLDVFTVEFGLRAPSNDWRFLTGLMFGEALSVFLFPAFVMLTVAKRRERAALSGATAFGGVLALGACAFFAKGLDSAAAYYVLESLGVLGNLSLFAFIIYGLVMAFAGREPRKRDTGARRIEGQMARFT
jgi:uncharacterized membrane protein